MKNKKIERLETRVKFKNKFATLYNDKVKFPDNSEGSYIRFCWNAPYGVHVFAKDKNDNVLLIKNYRYENDSWHWEIPKGFGMSGLSSIQMAKKELLEETGYTGIKWKLLRSFFDRGIDNFIFECQLDKYIGENRENSECISEVKVFSPVEYQKMIFDQSLVNDPVTLFLLSLSL